VEHAQRQRREQRPGIPNVIATRSIAKLPSSAWSERTKRKPLSTEATIGSC
jgi:hypothetical protein